MSLGKERIILLGPRPRRIDWDSSPGCSLPKRICASLQHPFRPLRLISKPSTMAQTPTFTVEAPRKITGFTDAEMKSFRIKEWTSVEVRRSTMENGGLYCRCTLNDGSGIYIGLDCRDPHKVGQTILPSQILRLDRPQSKYGFYLTTLSK